MRGRPVLMLVLLVPWVVVAAVSLSAADAKKPSADKKPPQDSSLPLEKATGVKAEQGAGIKGQGSGTRDRGSGAANLKSQISNQQISNSQPPAPSLQPPAPSLQPPASSLQPPAPSLQLPTSKTPPTGKPGPRAEEFRRVHREMNELLAKLFQLQINFRLADEDKQADIQQRWKVLIDEGDEIERRLIDTAERAYAEAPNADPQIAMLLVMVLAEKVQADQYEIAARIGKLLMDNQCPEPAAAHFAGIAAFGVSDVDAAEKYFNRAAAQGYYQSAPKDDKWALLGRAELQVIPYYKKAWAEEAAIRKREARVDDLPRVLLKTTKGDIVLELFEDQAPNTVANFINLVSKRFYNNLTFHRVEPNALAQGGDPQGNGSGGPGYSIACECYRPDHRNHFRGSLSMAHRGQDTGGSQFFLTFVPLPQLDGRHTVFGRVIDGMDVLAKLQRRSADDPEAARPDRIIEAKVLRSRRPPQRYKPYILPE
jgi:cyclophilin family peptidyl-prolyl cis-trans isomerase